MVIVTNSRAEDHSDLLTMTRRLTRKHLVVVVNLQEDILQETLQTALHGFVEAVRYQALHEYLAQRRKLHRQLQHGGIYALDITADKMPAALVNTYLEIKTAGSL